MWATPPTHDDALDTDSGPVVTDMLLISMMKQPRFKQRRQDSVFWLQRNQRVFKLHLRMHPRRRPSMRR